MEDRFIVVCYDIVDDKRRNKIAKILLDYGIRVQYSVFECIVSDELEKIMKLRIWEEIEEEKDKIHFYRLCKDCVKKIEIMGKGKSENDMAVMEGCYVV